MSLEHRFFTEIYGTNKFGTWGCPECPEAIDSATPQDIEDHMNSCPVGFEGDMEGVINRYAKLGALLEFLQDRQVHLEMYIVRTMEDQGAEILDHPTQAVEFKRGTVWDENKLLLLREHVPSEELKDVYFPEHEETTTAMVPARWDKRKLSRLKRYGKAATAIIEQAQSKGPPKLSVKPKRQSPCCKMPVALGHNLRSRSRNWKTGRRPEGRAYCTGCGQEVQDD